MLERRPYSFQWTIQRSRAGIIVNLINAPPRMVLRAIMLKGSTLGQLQYDVLALAGLMAVAMTIAVTRFRRTLD